VPTGAQIDKSEQPLQADLVAPSFFTQKPEVHLGHLTTARPRTESHRAVFWIRKPADDLHAPQYPHAPQYSQRRARGHAVDRLGHRMEAFDIVHIQKPMINLDFAEQSFLTMHEIVWSFSDFFRTKFQKCGPKK
jgi:hypothetical protein